LQNLQKKIRKEKAKEKGKKAAGDDSAQSQNWPTAQHPELPNRYRPPPLILLMCGPLLSAPMPSSTSGRKSRMTISRRECQRDSHGQIKFGDLLPNPPPLRAYIKPCVLLVHPHPLSDPLRHQAARSEARRSATTVGKPRHFW
jgi:hypothetical protein